MPTSSVGESGTARDPAHGLAAGQHVAARPRDARLVSVKMPSRSAVPVLGLPAHHLGADEATALQVARPLQSRLDRRALAREVLAVQRIPHLHAQRVAGGEAGRGGRGRAGEQRVPQRGASATGHMISTPGSPV